MPRQSWTKIGHLNVHSYLAKREDIIQDQAIRQVNIMCFSETFLQPHQQLDDNNLPMQEECVVFRLDRQRSTSEDLTKGGIMIVCPSSDYTLSESTSLIHLSLK